MPDKVENTNAEQRQLQAEWNVTEARFPVDALLHELFEAQVVRAPGRTALTEEIAW